MYFIRNVWTESEKEKQITFDNCSVANMLQRLFPTWHASTLPPFFLGFQSHVISTSFGHRSIPLPTPCD